MKDGTSTAIYQNGALFHDSGADAKDPLGAITEVAFGADASGGGSINGLLDDIGVWDQALGQAEIQSVMQTGVVPEPSTVAMLLMAIAALSGARWGRSRQT